MKKFKLEWKVAEKEWPSLDPLMAHCTSSSYQQPAITFCGGWLNVFADSAHQAVAHFKSNPANKHAKVSVTEI